MYSYRHRGSPTDGLADSAAGAVVLLSLVAILLLAFLAYQAVRLVGGTLAKHPRSRALWVALGLCMASWCAVAVALTLTRWGALATTLVAFAVLVTLALLCTARIVELYYDNRVQRPVTKETVISDVLTLPWWRSAA